MHAAGHHWRLVVLTNNQQRYAECVDITSDEGK
jgi:hypothetical protein